MTFDYNDYLDHLEEAIYWHQDWFTRVMRCLVFGDMPGDDIIQEEAHNRCKFGLWFNHREVPPNAKELVDMIKELHASMHELANLNMQSCAINKAPDIELFDELEETRSLFFNYLYSLYRQMTEDKLRVDHNLPLQSRPVSSE